MQKSIGSNIFYKLLLNTFNIILPLLVGPYAYRMLGPHSMGTVNNSETIFNFFFVFATFGVYQYGLREISLVKKDRKKTSQLFTNLYLINFTTSILALIAFLLFSYIGYENKEEFPVLLIFGFNFISSLFYVEWYNEAHENYDFIAKKTIVVRLIYVVLLFIFIHGANDYKQFASLLVLSTFLNHFISFVYVKRQVKFDFSNITIVRHLKPLFLVVIFSNATILYTQLDRLLLGEYAGKSELSYYVMAFQIMTIINTLMLSVIQVTIPRLSYLSGNADEKEYETLLNKISKVYFITLFPAAIGLMLIAHGAVVIYGGNKFANAGGTLVAFALYMIAIGIESILSNQIIYVKKKENILVRFLFIGGFLNLILNILLIVFHVFTPTTAIVTTTIAYCLLITLEYIYVKKKLKVNYTLFDMSKLKYLFYSLTFIPLSFLVHITITGKILSVIITIITCGCVYALILLITKDEILFMFLDKIKEKLKKK
ncbi:MULTISPECIES: oligosaccharide flippase family protein [unclassified Bacillus (in: firmicutes)]|uniref:oligosaccharide flippase family protein n=1 Tax=unclassified Bacillus (in: firmicutes) TaxID=185979 RepID=UPI0008E4DB79|nr:MULTISPECIES: oligosaccharide flippase family protein [unclassified Bacillus (in: firmicutes)]SFJ21798.1 Membrane protein involved in the export of O-antigen and teichoic acid [Bacillus sp. 71mf]SFT12529.1 Membrane protein involved in the export of O-antigen and teichoic acid [Bacillus sp. 103mf]